MEVKSRKNTQLVQQRMKIRKEKEARTAPVTKYEAGGWVTIRTGETVRAPRLGIYEDAVVVGKCNNEPDKWVLRYVADNSKITERPKKLIVTTAASRQRSREGKETKEEPSNGHDDKKEEGNHTEKKQREEGKKKENCREREKRKENVEKGEKKRAKKRVRKQGQRKRKGKKQKNRKRKQQHLVRDRKG